MADEAMYWLLLIYDFKTFRKVFGMIGYQGNVRTPMVFFAGITFKYRRFDWDEFKQKIKSNNSQAEYSADSELPF